MDNSRWPGIPYLFEERRFKAELTPAANFDQTFNALRSPESDKRNLSRETTVKFLVIVVLVWFTQTKHHPAGTETHWHENDSLLNHSVKTFFL